MRDHCHFTGKYRGAAHYKCKKLKFTHVIFHNLANYDSRLLMDNLVKTEGNIKCFSNNEEKYISFSKDVVVSSFIRKEGSQRPGHGPKEADIKNEFCFTESFKFMALSSIV